MSHGGHVSSGSVSSLSSRPPDQLWRTHVELWSVANIWPASSCVYQQTADVCSLTLGHICSSCRWDTSFCLLCEGMSSKYISSSTQKCSAKRAKKRKLNTFQLFVLYLLVSQWSLNDQRVVHFSFKLKKRRRVKTVRVKEPVQLFLSPHKQLETSPQFVRLVGCNNSTSLPSSSWSDVS